MIQQMKVVAAGPAKDKIVDVEYDDSTGLCNGSNAYNWNGIIEFTGSVGNWTVSFKHELYANVWEIL